MKSFKKIHLLSLKKLKFLTYPSKEISVTAGSQIVQKNTATVSGGVKFVEVNVTALTVIIVQVIKQNKITLTLNPRRRLKYSDFSIFLF